jgi:ribosomal protein L7/L12
MLMNERFLIALGIGVLFALLIAAAQARERQRRRLARLEAKLDALMKHTGARFDPYAGLSPKVADALKRGRTIEAIKEHREATGAGLKEAKEYVEEVQSRGI